MRRQPWKRISRDVKFGQSEKSCKLSQVLERRGVVFGERRGTRRTWVSVVGERHVEVAAVVIAKREVYEWRERHGERRVDVDWWLLLTAAVGRDRSPVWRPYNVHHRYRKCKNLLQISCENKFLYILVRKFSPTFSQEFSLEFSEDKFKLESGLIEKSGIILQKNKLP